VGINLKTPDVPIVAQANRNEHLDILRGLAILLVAIGHTVQARSADPDANLIFRAIYIFHMPLFFYISGMVYALKPITQTAKGFSSGIGRKAEQLLLPFFCWHLVNYLVSDSSRTLTEHFWLLYKAPDYGLWFLWVLFGVYLITDFGKVICTKTKIPYWIICSVLAVGLYHINLHFHGLGVGLMAKHLPFFVAGIFHRQVIVAIGKYASLLIGVCVVAFPFLVYFWDRTHQIEIGLILQHMLSLPMSTLFYTLYLVIGYLFNAVFAGVGIVVFFVGARAFISGDVPAGQQLRRAMIFIGQRTLEIYAIHFYFIGPKWVPFNLVDYLLAGLFAVAVSLLIAEYLIKPIPLASLLLLGKRGLLRTPMYRWS
jgi:fucose 4-O-acetylase-like acetyltransferase